MNAIPKKLTISDIGAYVPDPAFPHDFFILETVNLARDALEQGSLGVGAVLVSRDGVILLRSKNFFTPYIPGDLSATYGLLKQAQEQGVDLRPCSVFTSMKPSAGCLKDLEESGVTGVWHAAGGDVSFCDPDASMIVCPANCTWMIRALASEIFLATTRMPQCARGLGRHPRNPYPWLLPNRVPEEQR
jgi:tRNA(Arg) A34 adenosine deaminase TadA